MNPLNFLQHLFTLRAIERELADEKVASKNLKAENERLRAQLQDRDATIAKLRQENKELNDLLHAKPIVVETNFDPRKF